MEDKKLTPKESMELIASMIQASKQRVAMSDLRIPTMWATISILTAVAVWVLITTTHNPWFNFIWFAIPVIGLPANILLSAKDRNKNYKKTFIDIVIDGIWKAVGYIAIGATIGCFIAQLCGYPSAWLAMFYYAFIIVGFGAVAMGLLLRENSYVSVEYSRFSQALPSLYAICAKYLSCIPGQCLCILFVSCLCSLYLRLSSPIN